MSLMKFRRNSQLAHPPLRDMIFLISIYWTFSVLVCREAISLFSSLAINVFGSSCCTFPGKYNSWVLFHPRTKCRGVLNIRGMSAMWLSEYFLIAREKIRAKLQCEICHFRFELCAREFCFEMCRR